MEIFVLRMESLVLMPSLLSIHLSRWGQVSFSFLKSPLCCVFGAAYKLFSFHIGVTPAWSSLMAERLYYIMMMNIKWICHHPSS